MEFNNKLGATCSSNFTNCFLLVINIELVFVGLQSIYKWGTLWEIMSNVQNPTFMVFNSEIMVFFYGDLMGDNTGFFIQGLVWFLCPVMFHITQLKRESHFQQIWLFW